MDGEVRDLGFIRWRDFLAGYESMKGVQWSKALQEEEVIWRSVYNKIDKNAVNKAQEILTVAQEETRPVIFKAGPYITIAPAGSFSIAWSWDSQQRPTVVRDIQLHPTDDEIVYTIGDAGGGSESYELTAQHRTRGQLWRRSPVGPTIGIVGNRIYYLGVENSLRYLRVFSCNLEDGQDERLIYEETDVRCNLFLQRVVQGLYIVADNAGKQHIGYIGERGGIHWRSTIFSKDSIIPVGPHGNYIVSYNGRYISTVGWKLPYDGASEKYGIEWGSASTTSAKKGWLMIREYGAKSLYWCSSTAAPVKKYTIQTGTVLYDGIYSSEPNRQIVLCLLSPTKPIHTLTLSPNAGSFIATNIPTPSLSLFRGLKESVLHAKSADGTVVHGRIISITAASKALLVVGYGAYGLPTSIGTCKSQWGPLLAAGWAITYAFIRGGGDHNDDWTNGGRHLMRERSIEDFEAIITSAQRVTGCGARNTVIYGRSAGGLLVGATLNRAIATIAGVFAEVPYVDVLRTASNPALPLTEMEYEEFGNPHELVDFMLLSSISPIDNIVANGPAADTFVLCRSGLRDKEVLPYEPVKWIHTLRKMNPAGKGPKILAMETEEGHFYSLRRGVETRAVDLVMLQYFLSN